MSPNPKDGRHNELESWGDIKNWRGGAYTRGTPQLVFLDAFYHKEQVYGLGWVSEWFLSSYEVMGVGHAPRRPLVGFCLC